MKQDLIGRFREVNQTFPRTREIIDFKNNGGMVFGWFCTYVPEEIIHAAGGLPIRIVGHSTETELEDGTAYFYVNNCSFSRSCLQLGLRHEYDFLDGIVGGSTCDGARRLFDLWRIYIQTPFHCIMTVPRKYTDRAHDLYNSQVKHFKDLLEEFVDLPITDEALLKSIALFNESRELLRSLYDLRRLDSPPISGAEIMEILNASFRMPKELFNQHLQELLHELQQSDGGRPKPLRIMLVGSVLTNPQFVKSIEDLGAIVVCDELCTSTRYWSDLVVLGNGLPPLQALSRRYLNNFPCARMYPSTERFDRIVALAKAFGVHGVISETIRYCVPYAHDLPLLADHLKQEGLPMLTLDVEHGTPGSGQIQTRVQAFFEMLEARTL